MKRSYSRFKYSRAALEAVAARRASLSDALDVILSEHLSLHPHLLGIMTTWLPEHSTATKIVSTAPATGRTTFSQEVEHGTHEVCGPWSLVLPVLLV